MEPAELTDLVRRVRDVEQVLGHGRKETLPVERELRAFARRSIFAARDIAAGELLTSRNVAVLRSGKLSGGLPPERYTEVLGRHAVRRIVAESAIQEGDYD